MRLNHMKGAVMLMMVVGCLITMGCDSISDAFSYQDEYDDCRDEAFWHDGCPTGCAEGYNEEIEYILFTAPPDICLARQSRSAFTDGQEACSEGSYDGFQQGYSFGASSCQTLALNEFCSNIGFDTGLAILQTCGG